MDLSFQKNFVFREEETFQLVSKPLILRHSLRHRCFVLFLDMCLIFGKKSYKSTTKIKASWQCSVAIFWKFVFLSHSFCYVMFFLFIETLYMCVQRILKEMLCQNDVMNSNKNIYVLNTSLSLSPFSDTWLHPIQRFSNSHSLFFLKILRKI